MALPPATPERPLGLRRSVDLQLFAAATGCGKPTPGAERDPL
jgi:hypothetical protein